MTSAMISGRTLDGGPRYQFRGHPLKVSRGQPLPLGASRSQDGVNFVLICRNATSVRLVLSEPCNRPEEFCYRYPGDGPKGPLHRYDPSIILLDPAARALSCGRPWGQSQGTTRRSMLTRGLGDRSDDLNPRIARSDTILYELHVRGFTCDRSSGVRHPGTFAGLAEKIGYLQDLGVTAVELLPIDEFDENDCRGGRRRPDLQLQGPR